MEVGIHVNDITGGQRNYTVDLRGFGEAAALNTLVLVDGRRVNQADLSGTDWTQIPLDRVERIEVVRGGRTGVLYGDNATGGVINIITKDGGRNQVGGGIRAGSYSTYEAIAHATGSVDRISYAFSGSWRDTDGYRDNSQNEATDFGANLGYKVTEKLSVNLSGGHHEDAAGLPGAIRESDFDAGASRTDSIYPDDYADYDDAYIKVSPELHFMKNSMVSLDASYRKRTTLYYASWEGGSYTGDTEIRTVGVNPRLSIRENIFGFDHSLNVGVDYTRVKEDITNTTRSEFFDPLTDDFRLEKENYGFYVHDELTVTPDFSVSGGYRYDAVAYRLGYEIDGYIFLLNDAPPPIEYDESLYTIGVNYRLNPMSNAYMSFSRSYRYPVLDEFFSYFSNTFNTELAPQTSNDYEVGVRYAFEDGTSVGLNLFYIETADEIFYDPYYLWGANVNMDGDTVRQGIEFKAERGFEWGQMGIHYAYTDTDIDGGVYDGMDIPNVPRHQSGFNALVDYWTPLTLAINGRYVGKRVFVSDWTNSLGEQDAFFVMNAKLKYAWRNVTAFMDINNLLNEEYSEYGVISVYANERAYYPSPETNFLFGLSMEF
jgi:iron complex outermembrane receptor protein